MSGRGRGGRRGAGAAAAQGRGNARAVAQLADYLTAPRSTGNAFANTERLLRARLRAARQGAPDVQIFAGLGAQEARVLRQRRREDTRARAEAERLLGIRGGTTVPTALMAAVQEEDPGTNLEAGGMENANENNGDVILDEIIPDYIEGGRAAAWYVLAGNLRLGYVANDGPAFMNLPIAGAVTIELYYGRPQRPTMVESFFLDIPGEITGSRTAYMNWFRANFQWTRGILRNIFYIPEVDPLTLQITERAFVSGPQDPLTNPDSAEEEDTPSRIIIRDGNVATTNTAMEVLGNQIFLETTIADAHCVFTPIQTWLQSKAEDDSLAKPTRDRYLQLANLALSYQSKYADGIPEEQLDTVARKLKVGIVIRDVFENKLRSYNLPDAENLTSRSAQRRGVIKSFSFAFVRHDHLEIKNSSAATYLKKLARLLESKEQATEEEKPLWQTRIDTLYREVNTDVYGGHTLVLDGTKLTKKRNREVPTQDSVLIDDDACVFDVSARTVQSLFDFCWRYDIFHMFRTRRLYSGDRDVRSMVTTGGTFRIRPKHTEAIKNFNELIGLRHHMFHYSRQPQIVDLVTAGFKVRNTLQFRHLAANAAFAGDADDVYELDMKKAYSQFKKAGPYYMRFPSRFTFYEEFNEELASRSFFEDKLGIFVCSVREIVADENSSAFLAQLGLTVSSVLTLPSPEFVFFIDLGVRFSLLKGTWSPNRFDFDFSPNMLTERTDPEESPNGAGVPLYSYWTGLGAMAERSSVFYLSCDEKTARDMAGVLKARCFYDKRFHSLRIIQDRDQAKLTNWIHISAFVTSYARINVLSELFKLRFEDVIGLKLDSIIVKGERARDQVLRNELFREKELKIFFSAWSTCWYEDEGAEACKKILDAGRIPLFTSYTELLGAGGSGKTHAILSDKRYIDPLYVSFTNLLCNAKRKEYGCTTATFHKLLGMDTPSYLSEYGEPTVILLDEVTMVPGKWIKDAREMYPRSLILVAGDIEAGTNFCYQTTMDDGKPEKAPLYTQLPPSSYLFTTDYRSKCDFLRDLKVKMRLWMQEHMFERQDKALAQAMWREFSYDFEMTIAERYLKDFYEPGDVVLCGKNNFIDTLTESLESHGIAPTYRKIKSDSSKKKDRHFAGEILDSPEANTRKQLAFTTHSVQGMTVEFPRKLFLFVNDFFSPQVLYTAVSRAQYMIQICAVT